VNEEALTHCGAVAPEEKINKTRKHLSTCLETERNTLNCVRIDSSGPLRTHFDFYPSVGLT
jgi:hypothetical protein